MDCLSEDTFQLLACGELSPLEARSVQEHLDGCATCREVLGTVMRASLDRQRSGSPTVTRSRPVPGPADGAMFAPGTTVGRYVVLELLGAGGMGVVLLARDPELDRNVALKLIRPAAFAEHGDELQERLRREARAMARLSHPSVVAVHDVGRIGDVIFVAMEYVRGANVRHWLRAAPRTWREVLDTFVEAGRGLAAAHAAGLVHRDFKPDNVLVADDGSVRVADFGLARIESLPAEAPPGAASQRAVRSSATTTASSAFMGTPAYMAPEVLAHGRADARSDLFSFCVSLYEALYGERPFSSDVPGSARELREPPRGSTVPAWVRRPLLRGLRTRPQERPSSMEALLAELRRERGWRRRRATAAVAALFVAAVCVGVRTQGHGRRPVGQDAAVAEDGASAASRLYDDFSSGEMSGARWQLGEHQAVLRDRSAVLSHAIQQVQAFRTHTTDLLLRPPARGQVTTFQSDVTVDSATATGDTSSGAGIDLWFQPRENRLSFPFNTNHVTIIRVFLELQAERGLVARYLVLLCRDNYEDCSQGQHIGPGRPPKKVVPKLAEFGATWTPVVGAVTEGTWNEVVPVSLGARYTISITVHPARKSITFAISDRTGMDLSASVDLSQVTSPFAPDLSAENFLWARLLARMSGGNIGHGDGSVSARFNDVKVGLDGGPASPFDDFSAGSTFDSSRWLVGGESARIEGSGLRMSLDQRDAPAVTRFELMDASTSALQADVTVEQYSATGTGRIAAQLREALYNDGSSGAGIAPDDNEPNSEVGDVVASIEMTGGEVLYAVERCDTAQCSRTGTGFTHVQPRTLLGRVSPGTRHALYLNWDAASHRVLFRLDDGPLVAFDPLAEGYPIFSGPRIRSKRIAIVATASSPSEPFARGSAGSMAATFANVRTN